MSAIYNWKWIENVESRSFCWWNPRFWSSKEGLLVNYSHYNWRERNIRMHQLVKLIALFVSLLLLPWQLMAESAEENWKSQCAKCHGADGKAKTKAGIKLKLKDYTTAEFQESITDKELFDATKEGVKEGEKVKMKPFADKLSDEDIEALVAYIRAMGK